MRRGSARTCSSRCTLSPASRAARSRLQLALHAQPSAGLLHVARSAPGRDTRSGQRDLARRHTDTQTGRYVRLYSRRRLCARRSADAESSFDLSLFGTRKSTARGFTLSVDLSLAELRHGNRTQNSRVAGPTSSPAGIWSSPMARLGPVRNPVL
jgi:hypothetical protein